MCGTCGSSDHRTPSCTVNAQERYKCVNCNQNGHASWDRSCLTFSELNSKLQQKNPESKMLYFPSSKDPRSWETIPTTHNHDQDQHAAPIPSIPCFQLTHSVPTRSTQLPLATDNNTRRLPQNHNRALENTQRGRSQARNTVSRHTRSTDSMHTRQLSLTDLRFTQNSDRIPPPNFPPLNE